VCNAGGFRQKFGSRRVDGIVAGWKVASQHQAESQSPARFPKLQPAGAANYVRFQIFPTGGNRLRLFGSSHISADRTNRSNDSIAFHQRAVGLARLLRSKMAQEMVRYGPSPTSELFAPWKNVVALAARRLARASCTSPMEKNGPARHPPRRAAGLQKSRPRRRKQHPKLSEASSRQNRAYAEKFSATFFDLRTGNAARNLNRLRQRLPNDPDADCVSLPKAAQITRLRLENYSKP